jgi:redox-sensitive bicupin YhaK (pirin superfamily)
MKEIKTYINKNRPHSRNVIPGAFDQFVGPFVYFDHLGPYDFMAGREVYIPPHPHAGIATVSYLFSGEGNHADSLGHEQVLHVQRVNYMNAGNGIIHSEGLSKNFIQNGGKLLGVQIWHLLSANERNNKPIFQTFSKNELSSLALTDTCSSVILIGQYGNTLSPINTEKEMLLMTVEANADGKTTIQLQPNWQYLLYSCEGAFAINGSTMQTGEGVLIENSNEIQTHFSSNSKAILMGGPPLNETPLFAGSLVSVGATQMQQYKQRLINGDFGTLS